MTCKEQMEAAQIHAFRKLARAALENTEAEQALLSILENRQGALAEFIDAKGPDIYPLPPHLAGPSMPPTVV